MVNCREGRSSDEHHDDRRPDHDDGAAGIFSCSAATDTAQLGRPEHIRHRRQRAMDDLAVGRRTR